MERGRRPRFSLRSLGKTRSFFVKRLIEKSMFYMRGKGRTLSAIEKRNKFATLEKMGINRDVVQKTSNLNQRIKWEQRATYQAAHLSGGVCTTTSRFSSLVSVLSAQVTLV